MKVEISSLLNKRVLVTGASGFIGQYLIESLRDSGAKLSTLTHNAVADYADANQHLGDIRDASFVAEAVRKADPEFIFHLVAYKNRSADINQFAPAIETNLVGSLNLISAATCLRSLRSIVVLGSAEEYGCNATPFLESMRELPVSAYSFSKLCLTHLCQLFSRVHDLPVVILRPTLAYGPRQNADMFLPALIRSLIQDNKFPMTGGKQTRDFVYISDLVDAIMKAAVSTRAVGKVCNIGGGRSIAIVELTLIVERMLKKTGLVQIGALEYRRGEIMDYWVDNAKARELLGWTSRVSLEQGLRNTIDYYLTAH